MASLQNYKQQLVWKSDDTFGQVRMETKRVFGKMNYHLEMRRLNHLPASALGIRAHHRLQIVLAGFVYFLPVSSVSVFVLTVLPEVLSTDGDVLYHASVDRLPTGQSHSQTQIITGNNLY